MPGDQIFDTDKQSICEHCTGSKYVTFRHLAGSNGSFMCDPCYRKLFPATAMFEASQSSGFIRKTMVSISSTVNRQFKTINKTENEEEECHQCLEKGTFRKCCKKFYCRECYFRFSKCPGCSTPCHRSGVVEAMSFIAHHSPSVLAVLSSWALSFSLMIGIIIFIIIVVLNLTVKQKITVWNHHCSGWWWQEQCEIPVCIALNHMNSNTTGELSDYFPSTYVNCQLNETDVHILGNACIFDNELYRRSGQKLGFDICIEKEAKSEATNLLDMPSSPKFYHEVVIFEDTFDYWLDAADFNSSISPSAKWNAVINARVTDICGYSNQRLTYEQHSSSAVRLFTVMESSLVFTGANERYAETTDLNLEFGGTLQFHIKLAPIVENELSVTCKTAFNGDVSLKYSLNQGTSWEKLRNYPVWKYRNENFTFVTEELPKQAWSQSVRFKWEQETFDPQRDYWAIDNLRIFHQFNSSWRSNLAYAESFVERRDKVQIDQCCVDSYQCLDFPNDKHICDEFRMFHFQSIYIYATVACCILFIRKLLIDLRIKRIHPEKEVTKVVPIETCVCKRFQIFAVCCSIAPQVSTFAIIFHKIVSKWDFYSQNTVHFGFLMLMVTFDFWTLRIVCLNVFHFWPFQSAPEIYLTATEEYVNLVVNRENISLADVKSVESISRRFYRSLITSSLLTTMPISSIMILIKILKVPYLVSNVIIHLLGSLILLRSILGPLWLVRVHLCFSWLLTLCNKNRDIMGRALQRPLMYHISAKAALVFVSALYASLIFYPRGKIHINEIMAKTFMALAVGIIIGSIFGMMRYLPVACTNNSLLLTTWSHDSFSFSVTRTDRGPMEFHFLSLKNKSLLRSIMDGSVDISNISSENESKPIE